MRTRATGTDRPWADALPAAASLALYALSFPGPIAPRGLGWLAPFALAPLFHSLERLKPSAAALLGALYGGAAYAYLTHWLASFHPAALALSVAIAAAWFAASCWAASVLSKRVPAAAVVGVALVWSAAEFGRSTGFFGFPYGTLPYALYRHGGALTVASVGGTALVGFLAAFAAALLGRALTVVRDRSGDAAPAGEAPGRDARGSGRLRALPWAAAGMACTAILLWPAVRPASSMAAVGDRDTADFRVALVQPAVGEQEDRADYRRTFDSLAALTDEALGASPDLVAWHETAVVPPIEWHLRHRPDRAVYELARDVRGYLDTLPVPVLVGNAWVDPDDAPRRVERNAAVLYERGEPTARYDKMVLVPFAESFPAGRHLPGVERWLVSRFGYFWTPGTARTMFTLDGARFSAPICFEDSFGPHLAAFDEPDFFVVLTDDAWSGSAYCQEQHLSMSAFRAAETATAVLRVANTGVTAAIGPDGRVADRLPVFEPGVLVVDVPTGDGRRTPYEAWGRYLGPALAIAGAVAALLAVLLSVGRRPDASAERHPH